MPTKTIIHHHLVSASEDGRIKKVCLADFSYISLYLIKACLAVPQEPLHDFHFVERMNLILASGDEDAVIEVGNA